MPLTVPLPRVAMRVISLTDAAPRRAQVADDLADMPLDWAFLDACRADSPSDAASDPAGQIDCFGRRLSDGEVGCFKSHLAALSTFDADPALDWLLVMEDDVWLDPGVDYAAVAATADATGIGYLRLFARTWVRGWPVATIGARQVLYLETDPYGTQAYLISRAAAARFRAHLAARSGAIRRPIDDELGRFWEHGLEIFALFPFPAVERDAASSLEGARVAALGGRPAKTLARRRNQIADALAKRAWLARRRLGLIGAALRPGRRRVVRRVPGAGGPRLGLQAVSGAPELR